MCGGVKYRQADRTLTSYFPDPNARLPVVQRAGGVELLPWGRRQTLPGRLPPGGWARLDSVRAGKWQRYAPVPVRIEVEAFMEKDGAGLSHWYELAAGEWPQGLVARDGDEQRVYVVTVTPADPAQRAVHARFPRIVTAADAGHAAI